MNVNLSDALSLLIYGGGTGVGFAAGLQFVKWVLTFMAGRTDARTAHLDEATRHLIDELRNELNRLKQRCDESEERMRECEKKHAEAEAKVMRLEALVQARGEIRDRVQTYIAAERVFKEEPGK